MESDLKKDIIDGRIIDWSKLSTEELKRMKKAYEERERIAKFNKSMGLPVCFEDIEITEDDFDAMAEKVMTTTEWEFRPKNAGVTKESFIECMKETDDFGKALKL